ATVLGGSTGTELRLRNGITSREETTGRLGSVRVLCGSKPDTRAGALWGTTLAWLSTKWAPRWTERGTLQKGPLTVSSFLGSRGCSATTQSLSITGITASNRAGQPS